MQATEISLIPLVRREADTPQGLFLNIYTDIDSSISPIDSPPLICMAAAYALRSLAACLFLQGVINEDEYRGISRMFKQTQLTTGQSIDFQEKAAQLSHELMYSYDERLTPIVISIITTIVETNSENVARPNCPVHPDIVIRSAMLASQNYIQ